MIQKNPFLKYMMKDEKKDVFHSSAYAKAQSGEVMGAASTEDFKVRVNINQNRQMVRGYRDSGVMIDANKNAPKAKTYTSSEQGGAVDAAGGAVTTNRNKMGDAVVSNRGDISNAVISNRGKVGNAVISNRGDISGAVVSNRSMGTPRAPQIPVKRAGISIKK